MRILLTFDKLVSSRALKSGKEFPIVTNFFSPWVCLRKILFRQVVGQFTILAGEAEGGFLLGFQQGLQILSPDFWCQAGFIIFAENNGNRNIWGI